MKLYQNPEIIFFVMKNAEDVISCSGSLTAGTFNGFESVDFGNLL